MGILIELADQDYQYCQDYANGKTNIFALNNTSRVIKAVANGTQYKNRLKADMVAMLTELQLEIDEKATEICDDGWWLTYNKLIQQKINALKAESEGE